jgi:hypothetical protein
MITVDASAWSRRGLDTDDRGWRLTIILSAEAPQRATGADGS